MDFDRLVTVMRRLALEAGAEIMKIYEADDFEVKSKSDASPVTEADEAADALIGAGLREAFPDVLVVTEEQAATHSESAEAFLIVDPLDGTTNFMHAVPMFAVSVGLERDGEIVAGVVFNPVMNELFVAEKGAGAFLNDRRIRVAQRRDFTQAVITCGVPHHGRGNHPTFLKELAPVMADAAGIRRTGAASVDLCWVAAGRFDGFFERGLSPWDVAAGMLIVSEAGGFVSDYSGRKSALYADTIIAANPDIHRELSTRIAKA